MLVSTGRKPLYTYIVAEDEVLYDPYGVTQGYTPQYLYYRAEIAWRNKAPFVLRRVGLQAYEVHTD